MKEIIKQGKKVGSIAYNNNLYYSSYLKQTKTLSIKNKVTGSTGSSYTSGYQHTISVNSNVKFKLYDKDLNELSNVPSDYKFVFLNENNRTNVNITINKDTDGMFYLTSSDTMPSYYTSGKNSTGQGGIFCMDSNDELYYVFLKSLLPTHPIGDSGALSSTSINFNSTTLTFNIKNIFRYKTKEIGLPLITSDSNITNKIFDESVIGEDDYYYTLSSTHDRAYEMTNDYQIF